MSFQGPNRIELMAMFSWLQDQCDAGLISKKEAQQYLAQIGGKDYNRAIRWYIKLLKRMNASKPNCRYS